MTGSRTKQIRVNLDFTIGNVKAIFFGREFENARLDLHCLIFGGRGLDNNKATLRSYGIQLNDVLEWTTRHNWYDKSN